MATSFVMSFEAFLYKAEGDLIRFEGIWNKRLKFNVNTEF